MPLLPFFRPQSLCIGGCRYDANPYAWFIKNTIQWDTSRSLPSSLLEFDLVIVLIISCCLTDVDQQCADGWTRSSAWLSSMPI